MKKKKKITDSNIFYTLLSIVLGFVIGAIFLAISGISPIVAYQKIFDSILSKPKYLLYDLTYAAPLIFTGLSVAFSFRTGVFNIGAEGQFVMGSLIALIIGILVPAPTIILVPLCLIGAALAGYLWSYIVGILKVRRGIHEVLSYIMFNWIAFYLSNYMVNLSTLHQEGKDASKDVRDAARILFPQGFRDAIGCSDANWGIVLAILAAIIIWIILEKTTLGYKLKAVGFNASAAVYGGINSDTSIMTALGLSGALAGLGGAVHILGMGGHIAQFAGQEGYGFEGITVALIASSNPLGCIFSGLFYGAMKYGGPKLNLVHAPSELVDIIMGCIVLCIAISQIFRVLFKKFSKKEA